MESSDENVGYSCRISAMVNFVLTMLGIVLLAGCSTNTGQQASVPPIEITKDGAHALVINHGSGYSLSIPNTLFVWGSKRFFSTVAPPLPNEYPVYQLDEIMDYDVNIQHLSFPCSPSVTGASTTKQLTGINGEAEWGRVDYYDIYWTSDFPAGFQENCRPVVNGAAYALCSEKDGKTVLICISQVTDNPELVEEIFSTFRWTE